MQSQPRELIQRRVLLVAPSLADEMVELDRGFVGHGVEVATAENAPAALRQMEDAPFDLIVCDLALAGGSGLDLVRALRARDVQAPVLVLCGAESPLLEAAELGAFCLRKPVETGSLMQIMLNRIGSSTRPVRRVRGGGAHLAITRSVAATTAKNQFGQLLGTAMQGGRVVIKKHDTPEAVLLSYEEYQDLTSADSPDLDALRQEFDAMMTRMQTPTARAATDALFRASTDDLGEAAVAQARGNKRSSKRG